MFILECFVVPGTIALILGLASALQLLQSRSGNVTTALFSISGSFYVFIRMALAFVAYFFAHHYVIGPHGDHAEAAFSLSLIKNPIQLFKSLSLLVDLPVSHFYYAFGAGITSELMLRGAFQIFTVKDQKGERPFMFGLQRLVQALENYTCDRAATRDAHNKNKFIDKHIPDISFPQFMESIEQRLGANNAVVAQAKAAAFKVKMKRHKESYDSDPNDSFYIRLLATDILNTFGKRTMKYYCRSAKADADKLAIGKTG